MTFSRLLCFVDHRVCFTSCCSFSQCVFFISIKNLVKGIKISNKININISRIRGMEKNNWRNLYMIRYLNSIMFLLIFFKCISVKYLYISMLKFIIKFFLYFLYGSVILYMRKSKINCDSFFCKLKKKNAHLHCDISMYYNILWCIIFNIVKST